MKLEFIRELETERLLMKPMDFSHAEMLFVMDKNPNVHKYLWQKPILTIDEVYDYIKMVQNQYVENGIGRFTTIYKETGDIIGWTGLKYVNDHTENGNINFYDYGYRLNEKFWNQGLATESTMAWLNFGLDQMKLEVIHAYTHAENIASNKVLEKSGMSFMEEYLANDNSKWNWWRIKKQNINY